MIIKEVHGNLVSMFLAGEMNMIHGCNCFRRMGRGIALEVKNRVPEMYAADLKTKPGDKSKLGKFTEYHIPEHAVVGINAYTQYHWAIPAEGTDHMVDYAAVREVFRRINTAGKYARMNGKPYGIPLIGAGLAKGNWDIIRTIIDEETPDIDIVLVHYAP